MSEADRALARLLWINEPAEGDTIAVRRPSEWKVVRVVVPAGQKEKWLHFVCGWLPLSHTPNATHVIPGTLYGIDIVGQPLWYVKNHLARYLFDIPHAV